ncbi:MAG TPA: hypothetical protein VFQ85_13330 [Mycobacteriales bacterium]|jgi:hypothetical protein|nr:hypothetical protein [Mycobacteriales bacterium]
MPTRKLLALAAVTPLVLTAPVAHAATKPKPKKPVCNLIKDGASDGTGTATGAAGPNDPNLDILGADIATNAKTLTTLIRLSAVDGSGDTSPAGRSFTVSFTVNKKDVSLRASIGPNNLNTWPNGGTGAVDTKTKSVRFSVPLSSLNVPIKANDKFTNLDVKSWRWVSGGNVALGVVDDASSTATYLSAWPSCVKVGV